MAPAATLAFDTVAAASADPAFSNAMAALPHRTGKGFCPRAALTALSLFRSGVGWEREHVFAL